MQLRYGIPLIEDRVAPRCMFAQSVLVVALKGNRTKTERAVPLAGNDLADLSKALVGNEVDVLVCGGITLDEREFLLARGVDVVDNVAGSVQEVLEGLRSGLLCPGFGLSVSGGAPPEESLESSRPEVPGNMIDCLSCSDLQCQRGQPCPFLNSLAPSPVVEREITSMLEAALDVSSEKERTLCRLSELIYFCLEMGYRRIGIAYCVDLQDPCEVLVRVLRRFFAVHPVCCKISGGSSFLQTHDDAEMAASKCIACNPVGQAQVLNAIGTDLNVVVGMSMGADCVFNRFSDAPVTTLFVKDKSLANNPIGAIYSDYYLKEAVQAAPRGLGEQSLRDLARSSRTVPWR